ncbi:MAG TPA: hypothetical protein VI542_03690 [Candidatus Tectomicrobia bacterium]
MARTHTLFRGQQRRWLVRLIVVVVVSGMGWWWYGSLVADDSAPAFTLPSATGGAVALDQYRGRQPVVLVFYMGEF